MTPFKSLEKEMEKELSPKRFSHVMSVVREVRELAEAFEISDKEELILSALLHDCTKPLSYEEHLEFAKEHSLSLSDADLKSPEILHARTGAIKAGLLGAGALACDAIYCHTTGKEDMTVFEKILFLADYIEETRTHEACIRTRNAFLKELFSCQSLEEKLAVLDKAVLSTLISTKNYLEQKKAFIHPDTYRAIEFLKSEDCNGRKKQIQKSAQND